MSQILKVYLGIFMMFSMAALSAVILTAFLKVTDASNLHAAVITELEESNFAPAVMAECFETAESHNCGLTLIVYREGETPVRCSSAGEAAGLSGSITMAKVVLSYQIALMGESGDLNRKITGYAR